MSVVERRELDDKRLVALVQTDAAGNADVFGQDVAVGTHLLVVHIQAGEPQVSGIGQLRGLVGQLGESFVGGQVDMSLAVGKQRVPIELRRHKAVLLGIVGEHTGLRVEGGDAVGRGYP